MYLLLTGATGLLGRYLLVDLLGKGVPVAVLVRPQRMASAEDRIETILVRWEEELGRSLPRPVIIEGSLEGCGMRVTEGDREWMAANCSRILHSAASLKFVADPVTGEPWKSNLEATIGVLVECERLGIGELHAVSTAYVAGQRSGRVLESELDVGQTWGNVYEESKRAAEEKLRAARHLESLTIYRPSIIVGDSRSGYTSTYHGFYTPLRLAKESLHLLAVGGNAGMRFLELLGLGGGERKDLVPVDWVSAAIATIVNQPKWHRATYHLTSPHPVTVGMMQEVFERVLAGEALAMGSGISDPGGESNGAMSARAEWESVRRQMEMYRSYWRDDPQFDRSNTERALCDLPCPTLDRSRLAMLAEAAIRDRFGWPPAKVVAARDEVRGYLERRLRVGERFAEGTVSIGIQVTGRGGVAWRVDVREGLVWGVGRGLPSWSSSAEARVVYHLTAKTFQRLRSGELGVDEAIRGGRVAIFLNGKVAEKGLGSWLGQIVSQGS